MPYQMLIEILQFWSKNIMFKKHVKFLHDGLGSQFLESMKRVQQSFLLNHTYTSCINEIYVISRIIYLVITLKRDCII